MRTATLLTLIAVVLASEGSAVAASEPLPLMGTFSNVCVHPESGDLLGTEISFMKGGQATFALVQRYEGESNAPELMGVTQGKSTLYVGPSKGSNMLSLELVGTSVRITWLDGQEGSFGGLSETLVRSSPVWSGLKVPGCK